MILWIEATSVDWEFAGILPIEEFNIIKVEFYNLNVYQDLNKIFDLTFWLSTVYKRWYLDILNMLRVLFY